MRGFDVARPEHELFTAWAKERGVWINGVGPAKLPGRGLGIVALQHIKVQVSEPSESPLAEVEFRVVMSSSGFRSLPCLPWSRSRGVSRNCIGIYQFMDCLPPF